MLYVIVGTEQNKRSEAHKKLRQLGNPIQHLYSEHAHQLESYINAQDMFNGSGVYMCMSLSEVGSSKEILYNLLDAMKQSLNHFVIDEPFADAHVTTKLKKYADQFFDAKEEKVKDTSVFGLCDAFAARDKKTAWVRFSELKQHHEGEAIAGALWWKFQIIWNKVLSGGKTAFTKDECEMFGTLLVEAPILAHKGEVDLSTQLEKIILLL